MFFALRRGTGPVTCTEIEFHLEYKLYHADIIFKYDNLLYLFVNLIWFFNSKQTPTNSNITASWCSQSYDHR